MNEELEKVKNRIKYAIDFADEITCGEDVLYDDFVVTLSLVAENSFKNAALTVTVTIKATDMTMPF